MIKKILGFDVSSSTIGIAVLSFNDKTKKIKFVSMEYLKPLSKGTLLERLLDTRDKINEIILRVKPDEIAIEDILMFVKGRSSANTVTVLASFNRMVGVLAIDFLKKMPGLYSALAVRHGIKLTSDFPEKDEIPDVVSKRLNFKFNFLLNKKNKPKEENYDMADAIAVALMHARVLAGEVEVKEPIKKKRKKKSKK